MLEIGNSCLLVSTLFIVALNVNFNNHARFCYFIEYFEKHIGINRCYWEHFEEYIENLRKHVDKFIENYWEHIENTLGTKKI